jgi:hypothetical protein
MSESYISQLLLPLGIFRSTSKGDKGTKAINEKKKEGNG